MFEQEFEKHVGESGKYMDELENRVKLLESDGDKQENSVNLNLDKTETETSQDDDDDDDDDGDGNDYINSTSTPVTTTKTKNKSLSAAENIKMATHIVRNYGERYFRSLKHPEKENMQKLNDEIDNDAYLKSLNINHKAVALKMKNMRMNYVKEDKKVQEGSKAKWYLYDEMKNISHSFTNNRKTNKSAAASNVTPIVSTPSRVSTRKRKPKYDKMDDYSDYIPSSSQQIMPSDINNYSAYAKINSINEQLPHPLPSYILPKKQTLQQASTSGSSFMSPPNLLPFTPEVKMQIGFEYIQQQQQQQQQSTQQLDDSAIAKHSFLSMSLIQKQREAIAAEKKRASDHLNALQNKEDEINSQYHKGMTNIMNYIYNNILKK